MCLQHKRPVSGEMNPALSVQISFSEPAVVSDGNTKCEEDYLRADVLQTQNGLHHCTGMQVLCA